MEKEMVEFVVVVNIIEIIYYFKISIWNNLIKE